MSKKTIIAQAIQNGLTTNYSGAEKTLFVNGDTEKVQTFVRKCCLTAKTRDFSVKKGC